jgi:hypothetical protein
MLPGVNPISVKYISYHIDFPCNRKTYQYKVGEISLLFGFAKISATKFRPIRNKTKQFHMSLGFGVFECRTAG